MIINLKRSYLFQPENLINQNTPNDVLFFLVETCGKKITQKDIMEKKDKIVEFLSNYNYKVNVENVENVEQKDLLQISSFVSNKKSKWTKEKLIQTLIIITDFNTTKYKDNFGDITPFENNNLDISMLYLICIKEDIALELNDTYNDMKYKYLSKKSENLNRQDLISDILLSLNKLKKDKLFDLYNKCNTDDIYDEIEDDENRVYDTSYLMSNACLSKKASVIYGIKIYGIDFSESNDPSKDLCLFSKNKIEDKDFLPYDKESNFYKKYIKNKKFYNINKYWKSKYSNYYNNKNKSEIQKYESCDLTLLDDRYTNKNYYDEGNNLISYGFLEDENKPTVTEEQLIEILQNHNYFKELNGDDIVDYNIVEKLFNIADDNEMYDLKEEIERIRKLAIDNFPPTKKFLESYIYNSENIDKVFKEIRYFCFLLRGWKEDFTLPLKKEDVREEKDHEEINQSYEKIQILKNNLTNTEFKNLLCVKYIDEYKIKYTKTKLSELINKEKLLENIDYTTILLFTCYYYNKLCNSKIIFDIKDLEYIN